MCRWAARVIRKVPRRCTRITVSQSVPDILNSKLSRSTPALLTSTVGAPRVSTTSPTTRSTASSSLTSAANAAARTPRAASRSAVSLAVASSMSRHATAIPSAPRRSAMAAPMPRPAPVTMATTCSGGVYVVSAVMRLFLPSTPRGQPGASGVGDHRPALPADGDPEAVRGEEPRRTRLVERVERCDLEACPSDQVHDRPGQVATAEHPLVQRLETALGASHLLVGGQSVLEEVQRRPRPEHPPELTQRGVDVGD